MKQLFTLWVGCLLSLAVSAQPCTPTTTPPFLENFESFTVGTPGTLANGWTATSTNTSSSTPGWTVDIGGTGSANTGPSVDHTLGTSSGTYMFTETSSPANTPGDTFNLISPCIDLAATTLPRLIFWYHMAGDDIGTLNVHVLDGTTDSLVWSLSGPQQGDETDPWRVAIIDLDFFVGASITIRFESIAGDGLEGDMAVDDVIIYNVPPVDILASGVVDPVEPSCFSSSEDITVSVVNFGSAPVDFSTNNMTIDVLIGGAGSQTVSTTVNTGTLAIFDTLEVTVPGADLAAGGVFTFTAVANTFGDPNALNDTTFGQVLGIPVEASPYTEDFEDFIPGGSGNPTNGILSGGWIRFSTSNSAPTAAGWFVESSGTGNSTGTGPLNDHTSGSGIYMYTETSSGTQGDSFVLVSPCIDLAGLNQPRLSFYYHMFGDNMGDLEVHAVDPSGGTSLLWAISGQQQNDENAPWIEATVDLAAYSGATLQIAFLGIRGDGFESDMAIDDILIYDPPPVDMKANAIITPSGPGCYSGNEDITVQVVNLGSQTIDFTVNNMTVEALTFGASMQNFSTTVSSGTLAVFDTMEVPVTTTADFSSIGFHIIAANVSVTGDAISSNDTTFTEVQSIQVYNFPYEEDFETFLPGGGGNPTNGVLANDWSITSSSSSAATTAGWFVEEDGTQNTTNTGPLDDHTSGGSIYMYLESNGTQGDSFALVSPCIDLSAQTSVSLLKFYYHMFGANMGELQVHVLSGGSNNIIWSLAGQQQSSENDPFTEQVLNLSAYNGNVIQIAFVGIRGNGGLG